MTPNLERLEKSENGVTGLVITMRMLEGANFRFLVNQIDVMQAVYAARPDAKIWFQLSRQSATV